MTEFRLWYIITNISNKNKINLINKYKTEENIYNIFYKNYSEIPNGYEKLEYKFKAIKRQEIEEFKEYILDHNIKYITINDKDYPEELKNIDEPPYVLFYKGNLELIKRKKVAIIGARKCTTYGSSVSKIIAKELANLHITVVSGLADGIDSYAHKEVLMHKGDTIGVLGCGIDVVYPKKNHLLYKEMEEKGLIISEFLPKTEPFAYNFPRRNRIISGISEGLIVVEASLHSGTLITAGYALNQGKDILAVPGGIFSDKSKGCNKLIADGAIPFNTIDDLYTFTKTFPTDIKNKKSHIIKDEILDVINNGPCHLDYILENVKIDKGTLFKLLFEMQKTNEVICLPGNYYAKIS